MTAARPKQAVLNKTQLAVLEQALAEHGPVVTFEQLAPLVTAAEPVAKRQFVSRLVQLGWLVRIKNGVYQIAELSTLGTLTLSRYVVAQVLAPESYVSFEGAFQVHGLHDQMMRSVTSVSLRQHAAVEVGGLTFMFVKTKPAFCFGYAERMLDGQPARIATAEKALIDLVQLHRTAYTVDRVAEVLAESRHLLDLDRLQAYLERSNVTTQRIFGLLFDVTGIAYDAALLSRAQQGRAASRVTARSGAYDARWRVYYDAGALARYAGVRDGRGSAD